MSADIVVARVHLRQIILATCIMSRGEKLLDEAVLRKLLLSFTVKLVNVYNQPRHHRRFSVVRSIFLLSAVAHFR